MSNPRRARPGLPGGPQFLVLADESIETQDVDGLLRNAELESALRGLQSGTPLARREADARDVCLHRAHHVAGRRFPQRVDEVAEAALASFSQQQPDQNRTPQRTAEIQITPVMAPTQWPQRPELVLIPPPLPLAGVQRAERARQPAAGPHGRTAEAGPAATVVRGGCGRG
ncbi:hypothetical protein AB0I02_41515 [Streptomyces phaeochromogenes]